MVYITMLCSENFILVLLLQKQRVLSSIEVLNGVYNSLCNKSGVSPWTKWTSKASLWFHELDAGTTDLKAGPSPGTDLCDPT